MFEGLSTLAPPIRVSLPDRAKHRPSCPSRIHSVIMMSGLSSARSSTSTLQEPSQVRSGLEENLRRDEIRAERYGGDDPQDPRPKQGDIIPPSKEVSSPDPDLVGWDGPDDPENPQNWSTRRKWAVTVLSVLMTVNV